MRRRDSIGKSILLLLLAASTACTQEEIPQPMPSGKSHIPITLGVSYTASAQTRSAIEGESLPQGTDVFRVIAYAGTMPPVTDWSSPYFPVTPIDNTSGGLTFSTPRYYPQDVSRQLYFYAWSPSETTFEPGTPTSPPMACYTLSGAEDILAAQVITGYDKTSAEAPAFQFSHKLMRVDFQLQKEVGLLTALQVTKIELLGMKTSARLNVATGALSFAATPTTDLVVYDNPAGIAVTPSPVAAGESLLIEPQSTLRVQVTAGAVVYSDIAVTLRSGQAGEECLITLTFRSALTRSATPPVEATSTVL